MEHNKLPASPDDSKSYDEAVPESKITYSRFEMDVDGDTICLGELDQMAQLREFDRLAKSKGSGAVVGPSLFLAYTHLEESKEILKSARAYLVDAEGILKFLQKGTESLDSELGKSMNYIETARKVSG